MCRPKNLKVMKKILKLLMWGETLAKNFRATLKMKEIEVVRKIIRKRRIKFEQREAARLMAMTTVVVVMKVV